MPTSYSRPGETYAQLVSRVNANSHVNKDQSTQHSVKKRSRKADRIMESVEGLTAREVRILAECLAGLRRTIAIEDEEYNLGKDSFGYSLYCFSTRHERTVNVDLTQCSCEDNRFRHRNCKHLLALRALL